MSKRAAEQFVTFATLLVVTFNLIKPTEQGKHQRALLSKLLGNYNILERPVEDDSKPLLVTIGFVVQQIISLNEKHQYLQSSIWIDLSWNDANLRWSPEEFGNLTIIRITPDRIWRPDVLLYDSADEKFDGTWKVNCVVDYNGTVQYIPPAMLKSICAVNIRWFPFDKQVCKLKFGSWTYDESQVNITLKSDNVIDLSGYVENGEWALLDVKSKRNSIKYDCCESVYPDVTLFLHLKRLALYYYFNLVIPSALISVMALMVFMLPVDSGEKMGLSVTILLSLTVFMMVVAESMPRTSEALPLLGIYFASIMFICSVALVSSVWVLNLHYYPNVSSEPPKWVRSGLNKYVAQFLRMKTPSNIDRGDDSANISKPSVCDGDTRTVSNHWASNSITACKSPTLEYQADITETELIGWNFNDGMLPLAQSNSTLNQSNSPVRRRHAHSSDRPLSCSHVLNEAILPSRTECCGLLHKQVKLIQKEIKFLADKVRENENEDAIKNEWRFAARVVDRLCLIVFIIVTGGCTCMVLFTTPAII